MDLSTLQTFIDVMRLGSFAAVARDRNIDPSSISRAISGLEKELGVRLFQRTTRQLSPTEAGRTYFERVEALVEDLQQANSWVADTSGQPQGALRITTSVSFGLKCVVPLLQTFEETYPDLSVDLSLTDRIIDLFAENIDLAIRLGPLKDSTLIAQRLMRTSYAIYASPQYLDKQGIPSSPQEIMQHDCLLFPLSGFRTRWLFRDHQGEISEIPVSGRTIISNAIALEQCALNGMGLALLADWLVNESVQTGNLIQVLPNYEVTATNFDTAAWLVYPSRNYIPLKVRVMIDYLKQHVEYKAHAINLSV